MSIRARPVLWLLTGALLLWLMALGAERQGFLPRLDGVAGETLAPVQTTTVTVLQPVQDFVTGVFHGAELARENQDQRRRIEALETEVVRLREYAVENEQLRRDLQFKNRHPDLDLIRARVISEDPSNLVQALTIDQGQAAGIVPGMVAVSGDGLLGKVASVSANSAKIVLAVDPTTSIYANVQRPESRANGVVEGAGAGRFVMQFINQTADITPGDVVVTSGRGGTYPGGIVIGTVTRVQRNDIAPFQQAEIRPAVDGRRLDSVLVVANFLPTTAAE